jgi:hypothetical protein
MQVANGNGAYSADLNSIATTYFKMPEVYQAEIHLQKPIEKKPKVVDHKTSFLTENKADMPSNKYSGA